MPKAKHPRRQARKPQGPIVPPGRFFEKELSGEQAPSYEVMESLFRRAGTVHQRRPWEQMEEVDLIAFHHPSSGEVCYVSVMGALGQAHAVQVLLGSEGYSWFQRIQTGEAGSYSDFLDGQSTIFVHFVSPIGLDRADRELANCMRHPLIRGTAVPVFRAIRPGYHPWFVNDGEARVLTRGLEALLAMCALLSTRSPADIWGREDFPLVQVTSAQPDQFEYSFSRIAAPRETIRLPLVPKLDERRVQALLERKLSKKGTLEVDHFYSSAMIGKRNERKACMRTALAIDAKTGFAFPPHAGAPEQPTGELLQNVVLDAIDAKGALPGEIHVRKREFQVLLGPLSSALSFKVKVTQSLPALEFAKDALNVMLERSGF